jgi:hypothetical protein
VRKIAQQHALAYPSVLGVARSLEYSLDKLIAPFFGNLKCPSKNALDCTKVCSFASSMSITMPRILTDSANQFQTHFILEEAIARRAIAAYNQNMNILFLRIPRQRQKIFGKTTAMATGETASHPTKQPKDGCQVIGYSQSTKLSKNDSQVHPQGVRCDCRGLMPQQYTQAGYVGAHE